MNPVVLTGNNLATGCLERFDCQHDLDTGLPLCNHFERETTVIPKFYLDQVRNELGPLWEWLPEGALHHDPNAYLQSVDPDAAVKNGWNASLDPRLLMEVNDRLIIRRSVYAAR